jgi:restriction system protein
MKINENSLFAVLLRSAWWVSALVAIGVIIAVRLIVPTIYAIFAALPFIVIAVYVGWLQLRAPSAKRVEATLTRLRSLSWEQFAIEMEAALKREGYTVERIAHAPADFDLGYRGRRILVSCKRWKATRTGVEPLRELEAACKSREAHEGIYVFAGEITEQAGTFAAANRIRLLHGVELTKLLP